MPARLKARDIKGKPRGPILDLTGERFGSLVAVRFYGMYGRRTYWLCQCDCGRTTRVAMGNLRGHKTKSCGCLLQKNGPPRKPPEHACWTRRVKHDTVFRDFEAFLGYIGERPSPKHRLHRPDLDRPFGPGNCEWTLLHGRGGHLIEHGGLRMTATEWATRLGITKQALSLRLAKYPLAVALSPGRLKRGRRRTTK